MYINFVTNTFNYNINKFIFSSSLAVTGYLFKEDMIEKIDVVDKIKEVIETTKYNNKTINLSHKKYKETNVNPFLHLNLDSELAAENRMFIGVTKYLSELIIQAFSHETTELSGIYSSAYKYFLFAESKSLIAAYSSPSIIY